MSTKQIHIIDKVHVKVKTNSMENGLRLKDNVGEWINSQILPYIENYLAGLENNLGDKIIQFDQLKISLDVESGRLHADQIPEHVLKEMDLQLKPLLEAAEEKRTADFKTDGSFINAEEREISTVFHFLLYGKAPWYVSNNQLTELLSEQNLQQLIFERKIKFYKKFFEFFEAPTLQLRMIRQFSTPLMYQLIHGAFVSVQDKTASSELYPKQLYALINRFSQVQKEQFWKAIFFSLKKYQSQKMVSTEWMSEIFKPLISFLLTEKNPPSEKIQKDLIDEVGELLQTKITENDKKQFFTQVIQDAFELKKKDSIKKIENTEELSSPESLEGTENIATDPIVLETEKQVFPEENVEPGELEKGVFLENAGLILTHPFLKHFLKKVELIDEENTLKDPFLIVHVLHYIATGKQQDWDHNLLFEKFLCNVPMVTSIPRDITIPENILLEVDGLLKAMLQNWTILSNSSPGLLRAEFLQRSGKLMVDEHSVNLTVERKTQDILLDKLPWNISIVKLPWHKKLISTTWQ